MVSMQIITDDPQRCIRALTGSKRSGEWIDPALDAQSNAEAEQGPRTMSRPTIGYILDEPTIDDLEGLWPIHRVIVGM